MTATVKQTEKPLDRVELSFRMEGLLEDLRIVARLCEIARLHLADAGKSVRVERIRGGGLDGLERDGYIYVIPEDDCSAFEYAVKLLCDGVEELYALGFEMIGRGQNRG
jgi:hypothetical protein